LCEWLEMTDAEAGAVLGASAGAVRVRLSRARAALRHDLRGEK
jgi:DNA-directed RNA polymerase specialized sigma24 family protein